MFRGPDVIQRDLIRERLGARWMPPGQTIVPASWFDRDLSKVGGLVVAHSAVPVPSSQDDFMIASPLTGPGG
jgi:hypothetical protein